MTKRMWYEGNREKKHICPECLKERGCRIKKNLDVVYGCEGFSKPSKKKRRTKKK